MQAVYTLALMLITGALLHQRWLVRNAKMDLVNKFTEQHEQLSRLPFQY